MTALFEQIQQWAEMAGATHARIAGNEAFEVHEGVRMACEMNACGKSGRNWMCPPRLGELEELGARLCAFPAGVVVQNIATLEDSWDFEGMAEAAHAHNRMLRELEGQIVELVPDYEVLALGCGGCDICEKCSCPDAPCRFPEKAHASVEGYGMDIKALVESVGLQYINGVNTVSYVGLLLARRPE